MREAIKMAEEALEAGEVPIGCLIVDSRDNIVSRGRNRTNELKNATRHAEFEAIHSLLSPCPPPGDEASLREYFGGMRLYVTVEPCIMCAAMLRRLGLTRIYFGCYNERFGGCGSIIPAHTDYILPQVDPILNCTQVELVRTECIMLLRRFYLKENERAPAPRKKAKRVLKFVS